MNNYNDVVGIVESGRWMRVWNKGTATPKEILYYGGQAEGKETGFFHKGIKQVFDALEYLGTECIFFSEDDLGRYAITMRTENDPNRNHGDEMIATISRDDGSEEMDLRRMSFAGKSMARPIGDDRNRHYKSVVQVVINAAEAAEANGSPQEYGVDHRSEVVGDGKTCVFIRDNVEIRDILEDFGFYFKSRVLPNSGSNKLFEVSSLRWRPNREHQLEDYTIEAWQRSPSRDGLGIYGWAGGAYGVGYMIYYAAPDNADIKQSGVGDYIVHSGDIILDGDRELRNIDMIKQLVGKAWMHCADQDALEALLSVATDPRALEHWLRFDSYHSNDEILKSAFDAVYPTGFLPMHARRQIIEYATGLGGMAVRLNDNLMYALRRAGVRTAEDMVGGGEFGYECRRPIDFEKKRIREAEALLRPFGVLYPGATYQIMTERPGAQIGRANIANGQISLWHELLDDDEPDRVLLSVLIHEHRHLRTKLDDTDLEFSRTADADLVGVVMMYSELAS